MLGWIITVAVLAWLVWALVRDTRPRRAATPSAPRYGLVREPARAGGTPREDASVRRTP